MDSLQPKKTPDPFLVVTQSESDVPLDCALLSESSLGVDWNRPEEDAAWAYLSQIVSPVLESNR